MDETRRKCERLIDALADAHEYFVEEAQPGSRQSKERMLARFIPLAACLALAAMVAVFFAVNGTGGPGPSIIPGDTGVDRWETAAAPPEESDLPNDTDAPTDEGEETVPAIIYEHTTDVTLEGIDISLYWEEYGGEVISIEKADESDRWDIYRTFRLGTVLGDTTYKDTVILSINDGAYFVELNLRTGEIDDFVRRNIPDWEKISQNDNTIVLAQFYSSKDFLLYSKDDGGYIYYYDEYNDTVADIASITGLTIDDRDEIFAWNAQKNGNVIFAVGTPAADKGEGVYRLQALCGYDVGTLTLESVDLDTKLTNGGEHYIRNCTTPIGFEVDTAVIWSEVGGKITTGDFPDDILSHVNTYSYFSVSVTDGGSEVILSYLEQGEYDFCFYDLYTGQVRDVLAPVRDKISLYGAYTYSLNSSWTEAILCDARAETSYIFNLESGEYLDVSEIEGVRREEEGEYFYYVEFTDDENIVIITVYRWVGKYSPLARYEYDRARGTLTEMDETVSIY